AGRRGFNLNRRPSEYNKNYDRAGCWMSPRAGKRGCAMVYPKLAMRIAGDWVVQGRAGAKPVIDPATGKSLGDVPLADASQLGAAVDSAACAAEDWRRTPPKTRAEILRGGAERLRDRVQDLALVMSAEQGKPVAEAVSELMTSAEVLDWCA